MALLVNTQSLCICVSINMGDFQMGRHVENEDRASRLSLSTRRKAQHLLAQSKRNKEQGGNLQLSGGTPPGPAPAASPPPLEVSSVSAGWSG